MFSGGYVTVGRIRRASLRIHITTPLGLFVFSAFTFQPILWAGIFFSIVLHELGHAFFVRRYRLSVVSIDVTGIGGECRWVGTPTDVQRSIIAWGGVLAQGLLIAVLAIVHETVGFGSGIARETAEMLIFGNAFLIVVNLLPFRRLDGSKAWPLFRWRNIRSWVRRRTLASRASVIEQELARIAKRNATRDSEPPSPRTLN